MANLRLARRLFSALSLLALLPGCQMPYRYRPVPVLVRDAETKKPIAHAALHLCYPLTHDSLAPCDCSEQSGTDGIARLRAAPYGTIGATIEASAAGYAPEEAGISTEKIQHIKPPYPFEKTQRRPPEVVVEMYAEPRFAVEFIVPAGYHGLIKCDINIQDEPILPGQRCFRYPVAGGVVQVKGPRLLRRVYPSDYSARYADGTPLTAEMTLTKVGFRWLRGEGREQYYVVGTKSEYDMERRKIAVDEPPAPRHSGNGGGGQGHGHHHSQQ